jgi:DNA-binding beta-propeller fold protein YncE
MRWCRGVSLTAVLAGALFGFAAGSVGSVRGAERSTGASMVERAGLQRPAEQVRLQAAARCSSAVAAAHRLPGIPTAFVGLPGQPFGVATTPDGRWSFVDQLAPADRRRGGRVEVFSEAGFVPSAVRTIVVPGDAVGNSTTRDGRYLLVADGNDGATVVSVAGAVAGASGAVLGTLKEPHDPRLVPESAIEVASSPNGRYVFVSIEGDYAIAVYDLRAALASGFHKSGFLGLVPVGRAPVGLAVSPNGRWLYATSEVASNAPRGSDRGTLSVINVAEAVRHPARAVVATVAAGCLPVRVAVSADGSVVWVTAKGSNQLLAFSAGRLRRDPGKAMLAALRVGQSPVGLALVADGGQVIVADRAQGGLMVISTAAALAHRLAVIGTIPAGSQPREMALEPSGDTLLVGNFSSDQLEAVDIAHLR